MVVKSILKENGTAILKWNSKNKKYYVNKGYEYTSMGDEFIVKYDDLTKGSKAKVSVICDYCGKEKIKCWQTYINQHDEYLGDCCKKCEQIKIQNTWLNKYGVTNVFQSEEIKNKIEKTCLEKYGTERACQSDVVKNKIRNSMYSSGNCKTSKQQKEVFNILKEIYTDCLLNFPCSSCSLDCMIEINNDKIDVEYDGWFWHKNHQQRDRKRDEFLKSQGYKILRIKAMRKIPTKEQLINAIDYLVKGSHSYTEIILDII